MAAMAYPSEKTANPTDEALKALWQEINAIRRQQASDASQVQRLQRYANLDEKEWAVGQLQTERAILQNVAELARAVSALTSQQVPEEIRVREAGEALWNSQKTRRQREIRSHVAQRRYMASVDQEPTIMCPCGEHAGIRFVDRTGVQPVVVAENVCPIDWYKSLSRLAFEEGNLGAFTAGNKLEDYLAKFRL